MPGTLDGKVALVTGDSEGIGRATALTCAREGAKLVIADMHEDRGQQTMYMITANGEMMFVLNLTQFEAGPSVEATRPLVAPT